jgi:RNA polymerase sigma factor (sigma-70 family)
MANASLSSFLENIQPRQQLPLSRVFTDAQLLKCYLTEQDESAFELLMERHGPIVYSVCRRILHDAQDAEDACQATFLILARKAASIGKHESVSGWLYMVAYRIALRSKTRNMRRSQRERQLEDSPVDKKCVDPADRTAWHELSRLVDDELRRLPEKYRMAFILCHLEGKSCAEAAGQLGCPRGTVLSRVGRARQQLQARLALHGWLPASTPSTHLQEQDGLSWPRCRRFSSMRPGMQPSW